MNTFWSNWVTLLTLLFLIFMLIVVVYYWQKNHTADKNKTVDSFDNIKENDAAVPKLLLFSYGIAFLLAIVFLVLYPGLGNWKGLMGWNSASEATQPHPTNLKAQIAQAKLSKSSYQQLSQNPTIVNTGNALFQTHCAACHLSEAEGQTHFPNLTDDVWLYGGTDKDIYHSITKGRNGVMPGWKTILSTEDIHHIATYIASLQQDRIISAPAFALQQGKAGFNKYCVGCHGSNAQGNQLLGAPNLTDNIWLHDGSIDGIIHTLNNGLDNVMPAFSQQLSDVEIQALGAYIRHQNTLRKSVVSALNKEQIAQGQYLAYAGDCVACHTGEGGELFGGGLGFVTPFGTLYSTNISSHPEFGIGDYTYADFYDALHKGKGKHGYLYPAMPYSSYQYITDADTKALWAYMQSLNYVNTRNLDNQMMFPSNIRLGLLGWNIAFLNNKPLEYPTDSTESWRRGKYLTMSLGHCSECHTPRNIAQALIADKLFQGNLIDGWKAPNITATELYQDRWNVNSLTDFLKTGHSEKGTAFGGMAEVVKNSTRYLTREDVSAIAEYLITGDKYNVLDKSVGQITPPGFDHLIPVQINIQDPDLAEGPAAQQTKEQQLYGLYIQTCGACHGPDGKGRKGIAPTLLNNGIIMHKDPYDTIAVTIRGLAPSYLEQEIDFMPMSSFNTVLNDADLAQLITFVRQKLGGRDIPVTENQVTKIRKDLIKAGFAGNIHNLTQPMNNNPE